jgi:hypothetical protein
LTPNVLERLDHIAPKKTAKSNSSSVVINSALKMTECKYLTALCFYLFIFFCLFLNVLTVVKRGRGQSQVPKRLPKAEYAHAFAQPAAVHHRCKRIRPKCSIWGWPHGNLGHPESGNKLLRASIPQRLGVG